MLLLLEGVLEFIKIGLKTNYHYREIEDIFVGYNLTSFAKELNYIFNNILDNKILNFMIEKKIEKECEIIKIYV